MDLVFMDNFFNEEPEFVSSAVFSDGSWIACPDMPTLYRVLARRKRINNRDNSHEFVVAYKHYKGDTLIIFQGEL